MSNSEPSVRKLFEAFVYFRRQGATPDYALQELRRMKPTISPTERDELANQIRHWETNEGLQYRPVQQAVVEPLPPANVQQAGETRIQCTNCGAMNQPEARYCYSCGNLLIQYGTTRQLPTVSTMGGEMLDEQTRLVFVVRDFEDKPIEINIRHSSEIIIGRAAPDSPIVPDVDLTPYEGKTRGVSRAHATLKFKDNVMTVSDMGSVNNTYLNGERVHPQEIRILRDGDELRLGQLVLQVSFQKALKRISR